MLDVLEYLKWPVTAETTPAELDAFGDQGWALAAVVDGMGFFRRSRADRELKELGDKHAAERGAASAHAGVGRDVGGRTA